jgi:hypothetical protein
MDELEGLFEDYRDDKGDIPPPWAIYPDLERYTIGWRMGSGEGAMHAFDAFLDALDKSLEARLALLKRHPPAPYTWADWIDSVMINPADSPEEWDPSDPKVRRRHDWQIQQGLIASDIAYPTWVARQHGRLRLPWENSPWESPAMSARYNTREFAFMSRQLRGQKLPEPPTNWRLSEPVPPSQGLLCLAQQLLSGEVKPPWEFDLETRSFQDTYDEDMGYADAYRLWANSAFDDKEHFQRDLAPFQSPSEFWGQWLEENAMPTF